MERAHRRDQDERAWNLADKLLQLRWVCDYAHF